MKDLKVTYDKNTLEVFASESNEEQTKILNEYLGLCQEVYTLEDIFRCLPSTIEYYGKVGYLTITQYAIAWISYTENLNLQIIQSNGITIGTKQNIFDAFISAAKFIHEHNK